MLKNIAKIFIEMLQNAQLEVTLDLYGYKSVLYLRRMKGATLLVCHQRFPSVYSNDFRAFVVSLNL